MLKTLPATLIGEARDVEGRIREGRFQRSLSFVTGTSSILATVEVAYEHYRGSYGQKVMYTPLITGGALALVGLWGTFNSWVARTLLRWVSAISLLNGLIGFGFHIRGVHRKPGGWRLPVTNIIMGPPIFAPLLFGVSAYLGLIASFLRPEEEGDPLSINVSEPRIKALVSSLFFHSNAAAHPWSIELREGRFQKHLAAATIIGTFCSGAEAFYSHYKNNFRYKAQWSPVLITPLLMAAAAGTIANRKSARVALPVISILAIVDGGVGFFYHARGALRRSGGIKKPLYNIMYGPPIFAPLLFAACGALGLLASMMRRER